MSEQRIIQHSIGLTPNDWQEIETIARVYRLSRSAVLRIILRYWRQTRDPQAPIYGQDTANDQH